MAMNQNEAQLTLTALDRLIAAAEWMGAKTSTQRAVLKALRGRRGELKKIVTAAPAQGGATVVALADWRRKLDRRVSASVVL
jgi:hypothetical protein